MCLFLPIKKETFICYIPITVTIFIEYHLRVAKSHEEFIADDIFPIHRVTLVTCFLIRKHHTFIFCKFFLFYCWLK